MLNVHTHNLFLDVSFVDGAVKVVFKAALLYIPCKLGRMKESCAETCAHRFYKSEYFCKYTVGLGTFVSCNCQKNCQLIIAPLQ